MLGSCKNTVISIYKSMLGGRTNTYLLFNLLCVILRVDVCLHLQRLQLFLSHLPALAYQATPHQRTHPLDHRRSVW